MAPQPKNSNASPSAQVDIISNLPQSIREKIVTCLPIKEAGRTSILSTKWSNVWKSIPKFWIRDENYNEPDKTVKMIDSIMDLHDGPIHEFDLLTHANCPNAFDRWIHNLSTNGIMKFHFRLHPLIDNLGYQIPSSFFSCISLGSVYLCNCVIELPARFEGFKFLRELSLNSVSFSEKCIEKLVSNCPILETLMLFGYTKTTILKIHAPNLKYLNIHGAFILVHLFAPKLLILGLIQVLSSKNNLNQVFRGIHHLEMLELKAYFVQNFLAEGLVPGKFPLIFPNLKKLLLGWAFQEEKDMRFILSLLQHTPNLQELDIEMTGYIGPSIPSFWASINERDFSFPYLQTLNILCGGCIEDTLPFIKLVLGSASKLLKLTITHEQWCDKDPLVCLKQLASFRRASTKAQIIFE